MNNSHNIAEKQYRKSAKARRPIVENVTLCNDLLIIITMNVRLFPITPININVIFIHSIISRCHEQLGTYDVAAVDEFDIREKFKARPVSNVVSSQNGVAFLEHIVDTKCKN